jgi:hypothetical protein
MRTSQKAWSVCELMPSHGIKRLLISRRELRASPAQAASSRFKLITRQSFPVFAVCFSAVPKNASVWLAHHIVGLSSRELFKLERIHGRGPSRKRKTGQIAFAPQRPITCLGEKTAQRRSQSSLVNYRRCRFWTNAALLSYAANEYKQ